MNRSDFFKNLNSIGAEIKDIGNDSEEIYDILAKKAKDNIKITRRGLLKGLLATAGALAIGKVASSIPGCSTDKTTSPTNVLETVQNSDLRELLEGQEIIDFQSGESKELVQKWYKRYLGEDLDFDAFRKRQGIDKPDYIQLIDALNRMEESGDLRMVMDECKKEGLPMDVVFLALAESYWNADAKSKYAGGYWQFTKGTAALPAFEKFKLYKKGKYDNRDNPEISTKAALEHLKINYQMTKNWDKNGEYEWAKNISENDRWKWAMWLYNISPRGLKKHYVACKGKADLYTVSQQNSESENYVPRILAIRKAVAELALNPDKKEELINRQVGKERVMSGADRLYDLYLKKEDKLTAEEKLAELMEIEAMYLEEADKNRINDEYLKGALGEISKKKDLISKFEGEDLMRKEKVDGVNVERMVDETGFIDMTVINEVNDTLKISLEDYKIQPGDNIDKISIRASGDPNKIKLVKKLISQANPGVSKNKIKVGQVIKIPADEIKVPNVKLKDIIKEYYPIYAKRGDYETPTYYLKYLNGKNHRLANQKSNQIHVGEYILVPVIK